MLCVRPGCWGSLRLLGSGWLPDSRCSVPHLCRVPCDWLRATALTRGGDWTVGVPQGRGAGGGVVIVLRSLLMNWGCDMGGESGRPVRGGSDGVGADSSICSGFWAS
jgi:hypothetical protein